MYLFVCWSVCGCVLWVLSFYTPNSSHRATDQMFFLSFSLSLYLLACFCLFFSLLCSFAENFHLYCFTSSHSFIYLTSVLPEFARYVQCMSFCNQHDPKTLPKLYNDLFNLTKRDHVSYIQDLRAAM